MKKILIFSAILMSHLLSNAQDFNSLVTSTADTLAKKISSSGKKKVAITDFIGIDQSITQLGVFLSEEISSELANLTENQTKFRVLERANLNQIFKEKNLINLADASIIAKELGKIDAADLLGFATITDFDGYYRVVIKLLDTRNGDAVSSFKVNFVKTPSLENLNKQIIKKSGQTTNTDPQPEHGITSQPKENTKRTGDYCFKNEHTGYRLDLTISLTKVGGIEIIKTINVVDNETSCVYEIEEGVYKLSLTWKQNGWEQKKETKEIKVVAGTTKTIELRYN